MSLPIRWLQHPSRNLPTYRQVPAQHPVPDRAAGSPGTDIFSQVLGSVGARQCQPDHREVSP